MITLTLVEEFEVIESNGTSTLIILIEDSTIEARLASVLVLTSTTKWTASYEINNDNNSLRTHC